MWGSQTPQTLGTINPLDLSPTKHIEVTGCYSFVWRHRNAVYHNYIVKLLSNTNPQSINIAQKGLISHFKLQHGVHPKADPNTHRRSARFELTSDSPDASLNYKTYFKSFKVTNGGMLETEKTSYKVKIKIGGIGLIDFCLFEIDYEKRQCLRCMWSRFYDSGTGKCESCSARIQGCTSCRSASLCDSCQEYKNVFGSQTCLGDLSDCVAPQYSRYMTNRCDSCDRQGPNFCKCGPNYTLGTSSLGPTLKMCVCKIANCKLNLYDYVLIIYSIGDVCIQGPQECQKCKAGWYLKKGPPDECVEFKDIASLTNPRYGIDPAAQHPTITPCAVADCLYCVTDSSKCPCFKDYFYINDQTGTRVDRCSLKNDVVGYGLSAESSTYTDLTRLEKCSVQHCSDCFQNNKDVNPA